MNKETRKKLEEAAAAHQKLNRYSAGVQAAGGKDATVKYNELNAKADEAIKKLPRHLRFRGVLEQFHK